MRVLQEGHCTQFGRLLAIQASSFPTPYRALPNTHLAWHSVETSYLALGIIGAFVRIPIKERFLIVISLGIALEFRDANFGRSDLLRRLSLSLPRHAIRRTFNIAETSTVFDFLQKPYPNSSGPSSFVAIPLTSHVSMPLKL